MVIGPDNSPLAWSQSTHEHPSSRVSPKAFKGSGVEGGGGVGWGPKQGCRRSSAQETSSQVILYLQDAHCLGAYCLGANYLILDTPSR